MANISNNMRQAYQFLKKVPMRELVLSKSRSLSVACNAKLELLPPKVQQYVEENAALCRPSNVHICDGSESEYRVLLQLLQQRGMAKPLHKYDNCWLSITDPKDVARVESKTVICTEHQRDTVPIPAPGVEGKLGQWMAPEDIEARFQQRFPGCMEGRTMYVIPFSMGPLGSPLSKIGIECTDSPYVVASMRVMTRMGQGALDNIDNGNFVRCLHSLGVPLPTQREIINNWPCNPEQTLIAHIPDRNEIASFGSGYGGNSLLGKKCLALRLGSIIARDEGWLAEHMLILGITNPKGEKKYIAAAFPSACGKTNLAMMVPSLPGYKVECVGDDIAWMKFDEEGRLRAINPEAGFFGVAPGTSTSTNPNAMATIKSNTLFTNVAETSDGGFYWEGLEKEVTGVGIRSWDGVENWTAASGKPSSHPNSRFCTPANQCPMMDSDWESPRGVPIDAILFGGRRPEGVPLVYEAFNWEHGVFVGASMRSEATAAAEHQGKVLMNDPFAMRPFFGYNCGDYLKHWLNIPRTHSDAQLPKIFHVNWFRKGEDGKFLWPGFGENSRVLDWICRRVDGEECYESSPIGHIPKLDSFNMDHMKEQVDMGALFDIPKEFWVKEAQEIRQYFADQINTDMPDGVMVELNRLEERLQKMS